MKFFNNIVAALAAVAFLFMTHGDASALVLCIGSDGHMELESSLGGDCGPESTSDDTHAHERAEICVTSHDLSHCGECVDIPFVVVGFDHCHPVVQVVKTEVQPPSVSPTALPFQLTVPYRKSLRLGFETARKPDVLALVQSVTLLI